ncbi:ribosome-inactivating family protein [Streptomyces sp. NPDC048825]|uniref:ribosome-inactivating family protein n=1 Tax=Streptomyces sp. NPDC048825 TaxID=3365592 RepID=UPI00371B8B75
MPMKETPSAEQVGGPGHKRRSRWLTRKFLVLFLAVATLLGGAALVAPQFQEKASAIDDGNDITWDISGGEKAYDDMIKAVRQRATGGKVLREGVLQTDPTLDTSSRNIFAIDLRASDLPSSSDGNNVRLIVRARDLFIIGYQVRDGRGSASPIYFEGDDPDPDSAVPSGTFGFTGSYGDLERRGGQARANMRLNQQVVDAAYQNLRGNASVNAAARSMMVFVMMVAEAARFEPLHQDFRQAFGSNGAGETVVNVADAELMNSWGEASRQFAASLENGTPIDFQVDDPATSSIDFGANTLTAMAAILAICLLQNSQ